MENKNLKPFDLEAALRGEPVKTRDGRKAEEAYLFKTHKSEFPLYMVVDGYISCFTKEGRFLSDGDSDMDLFMAPQQKKYWVNVYRGSNGTIYPGNFAYNSKQQAKNYKGSRECIGQAKIWEEII